MSRVAPTACALLASALTAAVHAAEGTACEQLTQLKLMGTRITKAETITPTP